MAGTARAGGGVLGASSLSSSRSCSCRGGGGVGGGGAGRAPRPRPKTRRRDRGEDLFGGDAPHQSDQDARVVGEEDQPFLELGRGEYGVEVLFRRAEVAAEASRIAPELSGGDELVEVREAPLVHHQRDDAPRLAGGVGDLRAEDRPDAGHRRATQQIDPPGGRVDVGERHGAEPQPRASLQHHARRIDAGEQRVVAVDGSIGHVQCGEERRRSVAFVVVRHRAAPTFLHGQTGLSSIQCLDLALLIAREHDRVLRRIQVQPHDVFELLNEPGIGRQLERTHAVWLESVLAPDSPDR